VSGHPSSWQDDSYDCGRCDLEAQEHTLWDPFHEEPNSLNGSVGPAQGVMDTAPQLHQKPNMDCMNAHVPLLNSARLHIELSPWRNLECADGRAPWNTHHTGREFSDSSVNNETPRHPQGTGRSHLRGPTDVRQSVPANLFGEPGDGTTSLVPQIVGSQYSICGHSAYPSAFTETSKMPSCAYLPGDGGFSLNQRDWPSTLSAPHPRQVASPAALAQPYLVLRNRLQRAMRGLDIDAPSVQGDSVVSLATSKPGGRILPDSSAFNDETALFDPLGSESRYTVSSDTVDAQSLHSSFARTATLAGDQSLQSFVYDPSVTLPWPSTLARDHIPQLD
jgi:hypothetical protein